jgi:hypothetical protein
MKSVFYAACLGLIIFPVILNEAAAQGTPTCSPAYDLIAEKMATDFSSVSEAEISFALDCEAAKKGNGADPGPRPQLDVEYAASLGESQPVAPRSATVGVDSYSLGATITPEIEFALPVITPGERWVPELGWETGTRVAANAWTYQGTQDLGGGSPGYEEIKSQNRLPEFLGQYEAFIQRPDTTGDVAISIGVQFHNGKSGVEKDLDKAREWYWRAAEKTPEAYDWLGLAAGLKPPHGENDPVRASQLYAEGVAKGCLRCGRRLIDMYKRPDQYPGVTITDDEYFRYLVWMADLGTHSALEELAEFLQQQWRREGFDHNQYVKLLGLSMDDQISSDRAKTMLHSGELGRKLRARYRTGLVSAECLAVVDAASRNDYVQAAGDLADADGCWGRYRPAATSAFFNMNIPSKADGGPSEQGIVFMAEQALWEGALEFAALASARYQGVGTFELQGNEMSLKNGGSYAEGVAGVLSVARQAGYVKDDQARALVGQAMVKSAETCLIDGRITADTFYSTKNNYCRKMYNRAVSHTGDPGSILGGRVAGWQRQFDARNAAQAAQWERERQERAARKYDDPFYRETPSYLTTTPQSTTPDGAISSAEAADRAKRRMCSGSLGGTRFCQ